MEMSRLWLPHLNLGAWEWLELGLAWKRSTASF